MDVPEHTRAVTSMDNTPFDKMTELIDSQDVTWLREFIDYGDLFTDVLDDEVPDIDNIVGLPACSIFHDLEIQEKSKLKPKRDVVGTTDALLPASEESLLDLDDCENDVVVLKRNSSKSVNSTDGFYGYDYDSQLLDDDLEINIYVNHPSLYGPLCDVWKKTDALSESDGQSAGFGSQGVCDDFTDYQVVPHVVPSMPHHVLSPRSGATDEIDRPISSHVFYDPFVSVWSIEE